MKQTFIAYLFKSLKLWIRLKKSSIQLSIAIRVAKQKQKAFNKRFYVMPDYNGKLIALSKDDVNNLKRIKVMDKRVSHLDLMRECFYYTPLALNGFGKISEEDRLEKKKAWLKYYNQIK